MGLTVKASSNGEYEITPEGVFIARCIKLIDMGTQTTTGQFGTKTQRKIMVQWELLDDEVKMQDGRPYAATQFYTASLHEKAQLRKDLEAWRGKKFTDEELEGFDLKNVLGTYCQIQIVHSSDGQYANVNAIMSYKGDKPEGVNELVHFDLDELDEKVFDSLSEKMQAKIKNTPEWEALKKEVTVPEDTKDVVIDDFDDKPIDLSEIPFN